MFFFNNPAKAEYEKIFYDLNIESITGELIDFKEYKNKAVLVVNTASYCGFTKQYEELQEFLINLINFCEWVTVFLLSMSVNTICAVIANKLCLFLKGIKSFFIK